MVWFAFMHCVLFSLHFVSYQCEGAITSPHDGKKYLFLPGKTAKIKWEIDEPVSAVRFRSWSYKSSEGATQKSLADIAKNGTTDPQTNMFDFAIERPATLVLNNVNQSYNGLYKFSYIASGSFSSEVEVSIANAPIVNLRCPSRSEVNEGNNITFVCRGVGGNPPANVTWYKDGVPISETKLENNTLNLYNVNGTDSGNYTCVAQSYPTEAFKDEKSCELIVRSKPYDTTITFNPQPAIVGDSVEIMCDSKGFPVPHFNILIRNGEKIKTGKSHTLRVNQSDEGPYTCTAINALGNDSATENLIVTDKRPSTKSPTKSPTKKTTQSTTPSNTSAKTFSDDDSCGTEWYIVVVSLVFGIIIGIVFSYIVWCSHRRRFRNRKPERNLEPQPTEVNTTYQELDLTRMNAEDNYQSLRVNAASNNVGNDDDSTYTELSKTRDVENNYQSLT